MRIITFGIYHFWGKTEERKRIWSAMRLNGEPLHYHGLGKELFVGMFLAVLIVIVPILLISIATMFVFGPQSPVNSIISTILYGLAFFLIGAGIYRGQRYRLSRTTWRGIRGGLDGDGWDYAWTYFWTALCIPLTLGWILPWRAVTLQRMISNRTRFGDRYFAFDASPAYLYKRFPVVWFGGLLLLAGSLGAFGVYLLSRYEMEELSQYRMSGPDLIALIGIGATAYLIFLIISSWYRSRVFNYFASHTRYEGAPLAGSMRGRGLAWLGATNYLLVLVSFGILAPVARMRSARYMITHLAFAGPVNFDEIAQTAADEKRLGEGVAQAFDVDAF